MQQLLHLGGGVDLKAELLERPGEVRKVSGVRSLGADEIEVQLLELRLGDATTHSKLAKHGARGFEALDALPKGVSLAGLQREVVVLGGGLECGLGLPEPALDLLSLGVGRLPDQGGNTLVEGGDGPLQVVESLEQGGCLLGGATRQQAAACSGQRRQTIGGRGAGAGCRGGGGDVLWERTRDCEWVYSECM